MKRYLLLVLLTLIAFSGLLKAQTLHQDESFTLNTEITGSHIYEARDFVKMEPGFHYQANGTESFRAKTNPFLVFPPEGGETGGPDPEDDGVVGDFQGKASIGQNGAASYELPLDLPKGVNNMTPTIKLKYNSMMKSHGTMGVGWYIEGISSIGRTKTTLYHNGFIDGIDFDDNDIYTLDGQRLISTSGEYGHNETEYRTESEKYIKIKSYNSNNEGDPDYFTIYDKEGYIYEYGKTTDSRIEASTPSTRFVNCYLSSKKDRNENEINYTYNETNNNGLIEKISYSNIEIVFHYESHANQYEQYIYGNELVLTKLLSKIVIHVEGTIYKSYDLIYDYTDKSNIHLTDIILSGKEEQKHFNPLKFIWGEQKDSFTLHTTNIDNQEYSDELFGDYNGDGKTDIVHMYFTFDEDDNKEYLSWSVDYSLDGNSFDEVYMGSLETGENDAYAFMTFLSAGDLNGDGKDDLIEISGRPNIELNTQYTLYFGDLNGFTESSSCVDNYSPNSVEFQIGDVNGNGKTELIRKKEISDSNVSYLHIDIFEYNGQVFEEIVEDFSIQIFGDNLNPIETGDFNGDGKSNLLFNTEEYISKIYEYDGNNGLSLLLEDGFPTMWHSLRTGDFNGDNITDLLTYTSDNGWMLHYFDGKDYWKTIEAPIENNEYDSRYFINDFNGDGKDDLLEAYVEEFYDGVSWETLGTSFTAFYSEGNSFKQEDVYYNNLSFMPMPQNSISAGLDFNGDSKHDLYIKMSETDKIMLFHKDEKKNMIHEVISSHNHVVKFSYETLSKGDFYTQQNDGRNTVKDICPAWYVCHTLELKDGVGGYHTKNYEYEGAKFHNEGKGFLGFKKVTVKDPLLDKKIETINEYDNSFFIMMPEKQYTYIGDQLIQSSIYQNEIKDLGERRFFFYTASQLDKMRDIDGIFIKTVKKEKYFSESDIQFGNVTWEKTSTDKENIELNGAYDFSTKKSFIYKGPIIEDWIIGKVEQTTTTKTSPNNDDHVSIKNFKYKDGFNPLVKSVWNTPPAGEEHLQKKQTFSYNEYGHIIAITIEAPNDPQTKTITKHFEYSSEYSNRFLTRKWQIVNGKTFEEIYTYDAVLGKTKSVTDINNLTTEYFYDVFGRKVKTIHPSGRIDIHLIKWDEGGDPHAPSNSVYYAWETSSGQDPVKQYFDLLNRKIRTVSFTQNGTARYEDIVYNPKGKKLKSSLPYSQGQSVFWTNYQYDNMLRETQISNTHKTLEIDYSGRMVEVANYETEELVERTTDALGQLIRVFENGGEIDYKYFSSGNVKNITANGSIIAMEYDNLGNKTFMNDPSLGIYTYAYNALSQKTHQTNPKNVSEFYVYDELGRIVEVDNDNEGITSYTYDEEGHGLGKLSGVIQNNSQISKELHYDEFSRMSSITETIEGKQFITTFGYDMLGRQNKTIYPSGFVVNKEIDDNGYVSSIYNSHSQSNYLEGLKYNNFDQLSEYHAKNGKTTILAYDQYGLPVYFQTLGVMEQNYTFDYKWSRLSAREDYYNDNYNAESFEFDSDDRLTSSTVNGYKAIFKFGDNGNIQIKENVGEFQYGENDHPPHALTSARFNQGVTYHSGQEISYTAFDKISAIVEGDYRYELSYGPERTRKKSVLERNGNMVKTKFYAGPGYEMEVYADGLVRELHYIEGAVFVKRSDEKDSLYYTYTDYQGSLQAITDEQGNVVERLSFGPWGQRRNPDDWRSQEISSSHVFDRGYTGHEHLDQFGLINMNGRVYDPQLGRFLSPDPFVTSPDNPQNYNRYSYVLNNPMRFTDPTGYSYIGYVINSLLNTQYGGTWSASGGIQPFNSESEAFEAGLSYMNTHNSWGEHGAAPSESAAVIAHYQNLNPGDQGHWETTTYSHDKNNWVGFDSDANYLQGVNVVAEFVEREAQNGPKYSEQLFSKRGFQRSWTSAEGVGNAGGFFYFMHAQVIQNIKGKWYVYAKASARAPAAEIKADIITYYSTITVFENGSIVKKGNLQVWNPNIDRIGKEGFTYIGDGYMSLPTTGNNISIEISITYNMFQFWNGHSFPQTPFIHTINF